MFYPVSFTASKLVTSDRYIGEIIPKVVYMSSLLPTPENIIKGLNNLIYNFFMERQRQSN